MFGRRFIRTIMCIFRSARHKGRMQTRPGIVLSMMYFVCLTGLAFAEKDAPCLLDGFEDANAYTRQQFRRCPRLAVRG